jgi:hypothetical protein
VKLEAGREIWFEVEIILVRCENERPGLGDEFLDAVDAALALMPNVRTRGRSGRASGRPRPGARRARIAGWTGSS